MLIEFGFLVLEENPPNTHFSFIYGKKKKNSLMVPLTLRILSWLVWKFESRLPFCGNCIKKYVNIDSYDVYQWRTMNVLATFCATDFLEV